ncbi:MAG: ABC transporter transmembrane domain-containing protein [Pseudomonadota bacterium]
MDRTIFSFIWKHSKRDQLILLGLTIISFPLLYLTLELPKRIINDAIDGDAAQRVLLGVELTQIQLLALLCLGFLLAVIGQGLMKMQINTKKGVMAERLLRRFRYTLITRIMRFPRSHFRTTSQGELIQMVTGEAEPLGGIMGDMVAQPVFQAGMMLTILTFLFVQSPWLGLAATALIPVQAYVIPMLQRRINLLNKERVREVRSLSERLGETIEGVSDLRTNGGGRRMRAEMTARLGRLFDIRYRIYRQKFFMKFLNNFITQLTPFFFFSIGGYLAIQGDLTVGALVAALAAYKDLSAPWKELLAYYNQVQDMGLRWQIITEQFVPSGMLEDRLVDAPAPEMPRLTGPIVFDNVTLRDPGGSPVLERINLEIPPGATVGIQSRNATQRQAIVELLSREITPDTGRITLAGHALADLHQDVIAARVGHAGSRSYLFGGTIGDNVTMAISTTPPRAPEDAQTQGLIAEAKRAGNSGDIVTAPWLDPGMAGFESREALRDWWVKLVDAMGTASFLFNRGLDSKLDVAAHPDLAARIVALRPEIARRVDEAGLSKILHRFDPEAFNPGLPVGGNLLYATPRHEIRQEALAEDRRFLPALREMGMEEDLLALGEDMLHVLIRTFRDIDAGHPLFLNLGFSEALFERLGKIDAKLLNKGMEALKPGDRALLVTLPFRLSAEQIGESFPEKLRRKIIDLRARRRADLRARAADDFAPLDPQELAPGLTVLENLLYAKIKLGMEAKLTKLRNLICGLLIEEGLRPEIMELIYDVPAGIGGAQLNSLSHERITFIRAAIKRPDVLVLDNALISHEPAERQRTRDRLRDLMPDTTLIFLEERIRHPDRYDLFVEIVEGRIVDAAREDESALAAEEAPSEAPDGAEAVPLTGTMRRDLDKKIRFLEGLELFQGLDRRQLRLLAFSASWFTAGEGERLFTAGEMADAAYVLTKGTAELRWPDAPPETAAVSAVEPGRIVGDLQVIRGDARRLNMVTTSPVKGLRIGAVELRAVIESDAAVATSLLRTVSGYLNSIGDRLQAERAARGQQGGETPPPQTETTGSP